MEMIRKGSRIETRSGRPPRREAILNFARIASNMCRQGTRSSMRACRRLMALRQVAGDDLVDLLFGVRFESRLDYLVRPATPDDHPQPAGRPRVRQELLEVPGRRVGERLRVAGDEPIPHLQARALGGSTRIHGVDHETGIAVADRRAEKTAPAQELPDLLFA